MSEEQNLEETRRWYIVQTYSGYEDSVKVDIERRIKSMGMDDYIFNVLVPDKIEYGKTPKGRPTEKKVKLYPGYVFIEMIVTEESWFIVRNTPKVTGFLGSSGGGAKPVPLPRQEIDAILRQCGMAEQANIDFKVGDSVRIISGPFEGNVVRIESVNFEKDEVVVLTEMLGNSVETILTLSQIVKL